MMTSRRIWVIAQKEFITGLGLLVPVVAQMRQQAQMMSMLIMGMLVVIGIVLLA